MRVVLLDNQDSFVYNLFDALQVMGADLQVYRNTLPAEQVLEAAAHPGAVLVLSPGPGAPSESGSLPQVIAGAWGRLPMLGVCLGFQALVEASGGLIERVGPVHGEGSPMHLSDEGARVLLSPAQYEAAQAAGEGWPDLTIARYHSLGTRQLPENWREWGRTHTPQGPIIMAGACENSGVRAAGFQYHPESILTPGGIGILRRTLDWLGAKI